MHCNIYVQHISTYCFKRLGQVQKNAIAWYPRVKAPPLHISLKPLIRKCKASLYFSPDIFKLEINNAYFIGVIYRATVRITRVNA